MVLYAITFVMAAVVFMFVLDWHVSSSCGPLTTESFLTVSFRLPTIHRRTTTDLMSLSRSTCKAFWRNTRFRMRFMLCCLLRYSYGDLWLSLSQSTSSARTSWTFFKGTSCCNESDRSARFWNCRLGSRGRGRSLHGCRRTKMISRTGQVAALPTRVDWPVPVRLAATAPHALLVTRPSPGRMM